jgi:hypothetical protein
MTPLWPHFAVARAARDEASDTNAGNRTEERDPQPRSSRRDWNSRSFRDVVRRPIRRRVSSFAL